MEGCFLLTIVVFVVLVAVVGWVAANRSPTPDTPQPAPAEGTRPLPAAMEEYGYLAVVGESQYQSALKQTARRGRICWAKLVPETDNPFDGNAVKVEIDGMTVGYLQRSDARRYQRRLLTLVAPIEVPAKLIGGTDDKPSFGVLLDHREVEKLPVPKRTRKKKAEIPPDDQPF